MDNNLAVPQVGREGASSRLGASSVTLTCRICDLSTTQAPGIRLRTICPRCGNFYANDQHSEHTRPTAVAGPSISGTGGGASVLGADANREVRLRNRSNSRWQSSPTPERLPSLEKREREKSGGTLRSIANFFKSLGPNSRAKNSSQSSSPRGGVEMNGGQTMSRGGPISHHGQSRIQATGSRNSSYGDANWSSQHLPPIDISRKSPHLQPHSPRLLASSASDLLSLTMTAAAADNGPVQQLLAKDVEELRSDVEKAKETEDWHLLDEYFAAVFDSFAHLNSVFKRDPKSDQMSTEDSGLDLSKVFDVYRLLATLPPEVQKVILKAIINSLLKDKRPPSKEDLRAYLVLLLNPQFRSIPTYVVFAHLLRQVASLSDHNHHFLVHWFKKFETQKLLDLIHKLQKFISCRLFPPKPEDLPPIQKCTWWIPSATKVLALLNASSNLSHPPLVSYLEFYNSSLDLLDLLSEYYTWQDPKTLPGFSFCQYPFILSIMAKRTILQRDSEQQMVLMARRSLVAKVKQHQTPDLGMLFLNLTVRRSHLVSDSLNEIARKQLELKKKLKVTFAGEPGLDMGGLTKEWFLLLIRQIFQPEYGMFNYDKKSRVFWFSSAPCENYQEFNLVGVLMGLAVYNSIILDIHFPAICYKKLLSPAVVPYNDPQATVGVAKVTLQDLKQTNPDLAQGLQDLLDYEGDVEDDFGLNFQITFTELGSVITHSLKSGGENIPVTNQNCQEYVQQYVEFVLNSSIYRQFQAFYHGFHSVCASNALIMLRPEEVELLVCGSPSLDMKALRKVTVYDGYSHDDEPVKNFWEIVLGLTPELQKQILLFTTGSDRIPIGGMSEMHFKITRVENINMLPMSHTCFNQLVLPSYRSKKTMKQKLMIAIQNAEGFGLE